MPFLDLQACGERTSSLRGRSGRSAGLAQQRVPGCARGHARATGARGRARRPGGRCRSMRGPAHAPCVRGARSCRAGGAGELCPPAAQRHKSSSLIAAGRDAPLSVGPSQPHKNLPAPSALPSRPPSSHPPGWGTLARCERSRPCQPLPVRHLRAPASLPASVSLFRQMPFAAWRDHGEAWPPTAPGDARGWREPSGTEFLFLFQHQRAPAHSWGETLRTPNPKQRNASPVWALSAQGCRCGAQSSGCLRGPETADGGRGGSSDQAGAGENC